MKHFKDCAPEETVRKIKDILETLNVALAEPELYESRIGTYSCQLFMLDWFKSTNGKGMTRPLALASGYAEFMERLQNGMLLPIVPIEVMTNGEKRTFYVAADEKWTDGELTLPFYSLKQGKVIDMPFAGYNRYYGSNGMCAGNTPEEALVQGFSEIIERYVMRRVFNEEIVLPDIPEDYLKHLENGAALYEKYKKMQQIPGLKCTLKDASLGGRYPAAALVVEATGSRDAAVKFGCHPDYRIAIERTMTEASQNGELSEFARFGKIAGKAEDAAGEMNMRCIYANGEGLYPECLFKHQKEGFCAVGSVSGRTNAELAHTMAEVILAEGCDCLIRNAGWAGFPAYHIIVPGMSEMAYLTEEERLDRNFIDPDADFLLKGNPHEDPAVTLKRHLLEYAFVHPVNQGPYDFLTNDASI